jgi:hypothetical protein
LFAETPRKATFPRKLVGYDFTVVIVKLSVTLTALLPVLLATTTCGSEVGLRNQEETRMAATIKEVLKRHTDHLMAVPGVVGTAIGECDGSPCLKVFVVKKTTDIANKIPSKLEGFPVAVEETGTIRRLEEKGPGSARHDE